MKDAFLRRLKGLQGDDTDADFARKCGIPYTTMRRYLDGSLPGIDKAALIAEAYDVSLDWLWGHMPANAQVHDISFEVQPKSAGDETALPTAAMSIVDRVLRKVYRDEGVKLPADALMPETIRYLEKFVPMMKDPTDEAEAEALAPWFELQIRKDLRTAAAAPGTGKREAS